MKQLLTKFLHFVSGEILNLGIGYLAGLWASSLVSKFFVRKGLVNLWGLAAKREAVSRDDYSWLLFWGSYLIGLIVMLIVNFAIKMIRRRSVEPSPKV